MKFSRSVLGLIGALAGGWGVAAEVKMTLVDPAAPEVAAVKEAGEAAAARVAMRLVAELSAALGAGGPEAAVDICHTKALPLTAEPLPDLPQVVAVKRTSLRLRNPENAPDAGERAALDHIAARIADGQPAPPILVQKIETPGAAPEWRVYRPVGVQAACLACHGNPEAQSPKLRALLRQRYPKDGATGYAVGDWRGAIRVTVRPPASTPASPVP